MTPARLDERALILAPVGQDAAAMAASLATQGVAARPCASSEECVREIAAGAGVMILTEEALDLPGIPGLLELFQAQPPWSELPLIILTSGGESRRIKLLDLAASAAGSTTLLERPMSAATLWRSVQVALRSRRRQYLVRDLVEVRSKLAAIVESSDDAILSKDLNGIITSWNRGAERVFGYTSAEAVGQPVTMLIPPDRLDEEPGILERIRRGKSIEHYETIRRRKDGSLLDISLTVSPLRDEQGKIIGASKIARDITERKKAETELGRRAVQQQQLYELANSLNRPGAEFDTAYQAALDAIQICLEAPRAAILLFDEKSVMRFKAWRGLSEDYRRAAEGHSPWKAEARDAEPVCIGKVSEITLDGPLADAVHKEGIGALAFIPLIYQKKLLGKFMVYYNTPHEFAGSEIQLALTIANQLAFGLSRKKNEDALRSASYRLANQAKDLGRLVEERTAELSRTNQQLEAFVYSIAHDLRSPLRSMQSFSEMLLEEPVLTESGRDFAGRINRSAQFMDRLLTDLLNFSRLTKQQIALAPVELESVVHSALAFLDPKIREKNARVEAAGGWPRVQGHEPTLAQVLINLVDNAVKFTAPDSVPVVRLRAEERDGFVRVWVQDNGIGISPAYQDQVFRLFARLHGKEYPGTGIGLAIVQKGVEHMGGRVGLESVEGQGSRFWFELPKARE